MWGLFRSKSDTAEIKSLKEYNDVLKERNAQLEKELALSQDLRLKYEVARMLIDDDPMIDELIQYGQDCLNNNRNRYADNAIDVINNRVNSLTRRGF